MKSITAHKDKLSQFLKVWLKKLCSDLHNTGVQVIVFSLLVVLLGWQSGLIPKTAIDKATESLRTLLVLLQLPTPLWATILLILAVGLYVSRKKKESPALPAPPTSRTEYFTIDKYTWKTTIHKDNKYEVEKIPLCAKHDLPLVSNGRFYYCPEMSKSACANRLTVIDYPLTYQKAKSYIDKEIRNGK